MAISSFSFPPEHLEQLARGISALTIDPYKNALYYFFPFIGAFFANYQELRNDPAQEAMMPKNPTAIALKEIRDLTHCAGISREVLPYVALNHQFSSCGGSCSMTRPALLIPDHFLFRRNGLSSFSQEKPHENLRKQRWIFSDDETRFLIARELGQIKENSALLKIAIKVATLAAFLIVLASSSGALGAILYAGVLSTHLFFERMFQARADFAGVKILGKKIANPIKVAIDTLEKVRQQNLYRRENSKIARLYITQSGNNAFDLIYPSLTTRIKRLKKCAGNF